MKFTKESIENLLKDPSLSYWLKQNIEALSKRDIVDALNDVHILLDVLQYKYDQMTGGK